MSSTQLSIIIIAEIVGRSSCDVGLLGVGMEIGRAVIQFRHPKLNTFGVVLHSTYCLLIHCSLLHVASHKVGVAIKIKHNNYSCRND